MRMQRSFTVTILILASSTVLFAQGSPSSQLSPPSDNNKAPAGTPPAQNKNTKKGQATPAKPSCTDPIIRLGALSGTDADALAKTLSSVFQGRFVVSACSSTQGSGGGGDSAAPGSDSSASSKDTLQVVDTMKVSSPTPKKAGAAASNPFACDVSDPVSCALLALARSLDRDNFKGGILSSAFLVPIPNPGFAVKASIAFAHPAPDFDVELVDPLPAYLAGLKKSSCAAVGKKSCPQKSPEDHKKCLNEIEANTAACERDWDNSPPSDAMKKAGEQAAKDFEAKHAVNSVFLVLVPSPLALGQSALAKTVAQDAAALKHDFEQLLDRRNSDAGVSCPQSHDPVVAERCLREDTVTLSLLDPRDVVLHARDLFDNVVQVQLFPLNHSVAILPQPQTIDAIAVEQYELYRQDQKQKQLVALLQAGPPAASTPASPTTTTTTTIKTPVPASSSGGAAGQGKGAQTTVSSSITTSTSTQTSGSGGSSGQGAAGSGSGSGSGQGGGGASGGSAGSGGSGGSGSAGGGQSATAQAQAQPAAPNWGIDNIVRLYDYRDAAGIAAAINGMVSYVPNSRPIVQALSDFGANDMIEVLPSAAQQGGYNIGDIERAISLLDLPRPQVSLQVWSYQISAKVKHPSEPYKNKRRCPKEKRSGSQSALPCPNDISDDDARVALQSVNVRVDQANGAMIQALEAGMEAVVAKAADSPEDFFIDKMEPEKPAYNFRSYLVDKYQDCVKKGRYCLGYFNALDIPTKNQAGLVNASLGRLMLFLAAAGKQQAKDLADDTKGDSIVYQMRHALEEPAPACPKPCEQPPRCTRTCCTRCYFSRFSAQLRRITEPGNLRVMRAAFLDFFFNYKWTINYPNDFVPYDLRRSAHALDDLLQPVVNAFNQDIDDYVQDQLDDPNLIPKTAKAGLVTQGKVQVAALSGTPALVAGQVSNYFNITQTPSLSQVAQSLLASGGGGSSGGGGNSGGGGSGGGGGGGNSSGGAQGSAGGGSGGGGKGGSGGGGTSALQGLISTNPYVVGGEALAAILAPQKLTAEVSRGITLVVTPTSLDTASSAELNVNLVVNEPSGAPQSVNSSAVTRDLLDRVATHTVTDTVRVQSLRLFDLSTLSLQVTHPQAPTCLPIYEGENAFWITLSYVPAVPFAVPCAVWRSVFGSMPGANRLFVWPRLPLTIDNRSVAIIRATVVPTAMDLGEAMDFESDRVLDPVTGITESFSSVSQLGWKARQFHRLMMQCALNDSALQGRDVTCQTLTLENVHDDIRKTTTN